MRQLNNEEYYKRVEEDLSLQHEQLINQLISDLINDGDLDMARANFKDQLTQEHQFFTCFPKFTNPIILDDLLSPPLRAIQRNYWHIYMDEFLRPLAQALPSHIRDTTDFII